MKATLNLAENTILMDCTPQELAGLLSLLQPRPKQALPSSDHHPDEPPAPAEPVQEQKPEPAPQAPEPAPADHDLEQDPEPAPQAPEPAAADLDQEQKPEPALQAPEPAPADLDQDPEPSSQEPEPVIPPEPAEREPLGKAIERLKKNAVHPMKYQPVYARNDDGDTIYRDSMFELALALNVTVAAVRQAIKKGFRCKGYKIKFDDPKTPLL